MLKTWIYCANLNYDFTLQYYTSLIILMLFSVRHCAKCNEFDILTENPDVGDYAETIVQRIFLRGRQCARLRFSCYPGDYFHLAYLDGTVYDNAFANPLVVECGRDRQWRGIGSNEVVVEFYCYTKRKTFSTINHSYSIKSVH